MLQSWLNHVIDSFELHDDGFEYLMMRGVKEELIADFKIKQWDSKRVDIELPEEFEESFGKKGYRLNNTLVFPFTSYKNGEIFGFESRKIKEKVIFKYTKPENKKIDSALFGLNQNSFEKIWNGATICLVEGIFDLFALTWCANPKHVIISSATANLSNTQFKFFRRFLSDRNQVYIVYDNDGPGLEGAEIVSKMLKFTKIKNQIIRYNIAKDPGEIWDRFGVEGLKKQFETTLGW